MTMVVTGDNNSVDITSCNAHSISCSFVFRFCDYKLINMLKLLYLVFIISSSKGITQ